MGQGEIAVLPPNQTYLGTPPMFVETIAIYIDQQFAIDQLRWLPNTAPFLEELLSLTTPRPLPITSVHRPQLHRHLWELAQLDITAPSNELQRLAGMARVLELLLPAPGRVAPITSQSHAEIADAIRHLENNLASQWTVKSLAELVALSPSQLTRLFIQYTGTSPSRHLREARAHRMHQLISEEDLNVTEAARAVGWDDLSHASRVYRNVFGQAPSSVKSSRPQTLDRHAVEDW